MSNHLGSTACIFPLTGLNRTPIAQQITDAYGIPVTLQGAADPQRSRTSFIGRDVDKESDLGAFGVRQYSKEYGRFMSVDPMWAKYRPLTPYHYGANAPTYTKDPGGDTIIILWDYEGAIGSGHAAILIGSEKEGWYYYSKNGGSGVLGLGGASENPDLGRHFATLAEFRESGKNEQGIGRYDAATMIPTTKEEDAKAKEAAKESAASDYALVGTSCVDVVSDALEAVGKDPGYTLVAPMPFAPKSRLSNIEKRNDGTCYCDKVIDKDRKNK